MRRENEEEETEDGAWDTSVFKGDSGRAFSEKVRKK